jgi:nucleoid-associated protein YgaU
MPFIGKKFNKDLDQSDRGNYQCTFGFESISYKKDDVMDIWKPTVRKGTTARDVQNLCTLMQIAHAIYGDGQFFTDDK